MDAALLFKLFQLPVDRRHADIFPARAQHVGKLRRAHGSIRTCGETFQHCLLLLGRIGRHNKISNLKMKIIFK